MLEQEGIPYRYRDFCKEPLGIGELERLFEMLGAEPSGVLRKRDRAYKSLELTGEEPAAELIAHMAAHPTLLERPIGVAGDRAVVGRPIERLLELAVSR